MNEEELDLLVTRVASSNIEESDMIVRARRLSRMADKVKAATQRMRQSVSTSTSESNASLKAELE